MATKKPANEGLYANINAKQERIKNGSGEKMNKVGSKAAPTKKDFKEASKTAKKGQCMSNKNPSATKKGPGRFHKQGYKRPNKKGKR